MVKISVPGVILILMLLGLSAYAQGVTTISKDELKRELGRPGLKILDVRTNSDWEASQWKIAGAVREDPSKIESWIGKYPKDLKIVLYCA